MWSWQPFSNWYYGLRRGYELSKIMRNSKTNLPSWWWPSPESPMIVVFTRLPFLSSSPITVKSSKSRKTMNLLTLFLWNRNSFYYQSQSVFSSISCFNIQRFDEGFPRFFDLRRFDEFLFSQCFLPFLVLTSNVLTKVFRDFLIFGDLTNFYDKTTHVFYDFTDFFSTIPFHEFC